MGEVIRHVPKRRNLLSIAIDVDDVLANYVPAFIDFCELREKRKLPYPTKWAFASDWGLDQETVFTYMRWFALKGHYKDLEQVARASEFVSELKERGHTVKIVTARAHLPEISDILKRRVVADTAHWLEEYNIDFDELHFTNRKSDVPFDVLIDDSPTHLMSAVLNSRSVICMNQPYNEEWDDDRTREVYPGKIRRAASWWRIYEHIIELEGIKR